MSWGERSCSRKPCPIPDECKPRTCNVNCRMYLWDEVTKPDSEPNEKLAEVLAIGPVSPKDIDDYFKKQFDLQKFPPIKIKTQNGSGRKAKSRRRR